MSRIISGLAGSLRLAAASSQTRPTSDRVKESLFASLESQDLLLGAKVLDLFAGSGALGLEALSRGAQSLVMVEKGRGAFEVCKKNGEFVLTSLSKQGSVVEILYRNSDATQFLRSNDQEFDLVFVDPPYEFADSKLIELLGLLQTKLTPAGAVVLERSARSEVIEVAGLERYAEKTYGDTALSFFRRFSQ
jgi:16S rRNA (guanine966-N2)-methyltransferase